MWRCAPPSTLHSAAVTWPERGETRYATTCAMSSGWPIRPVGSGRISVTMRVIAVSLSVPHRVAAWSPKPTRRVVEIADFRQPRGVAAEVDEAAATGRQHRGHGRATHAAGGVEVEAERGQPLFVGDVEEAG